MKKYSMFLAFVTLTTVLSQTSGAATLQVGPGKSFTRPCDAIAAANAGDTIEIDSRATYSGASCAWKTDGLTIRGIGGARAHIDAGGQNSRSKAIWVIAGKNTTIENIEFSGASTTSRNGAGILQQGDNLTVRNCYFHNNEDGILAESSPASKILIEFSEFGHNGFGDGQSHNVYIGRVAQLIFRYNYSHHANFGDLLKSRAAENVIVYNRLSDESTGNFSYQIDFPNGGLSYLIGNVIEQGPANANSTLVSYLEEGVTEVNASAQFYAVNNTFINHGVSGTFIFLASPAAPAVIKNNIFFGPGTITNQLSATQANNFAGDPGFINATAQVYHLASGSPAIDHAVNPGTDGDFSLLPEFQYVHPACAERRSTVGSLDIGAFEFNGGSGVPLVGGSCRAAIVPASAPSVAPSPLLVRASTLAGPLTSAPAAAALPPSGLVAAYGFNEGSGAVAHDLSGNNNNGTITNAAWTTSGRYGAALSFNGSNSLVTVPEAASLDLKTALTLEAWVKPTAAPSGFQAILFKEMPGDTAYYLYRSGYNASPLGGVFIGAEQSLVGNSGLALNTWTHLAFSYNGTVEQLYVNGVLAASRNQTGTVQVSTGVLHIGGDSVWGEYFLGSIDEIRIYNRALSITEIQTDMNTPLAPADTTPPSVAISSPVNGASLTGTTTVTASASDNVGVVGVQFQLDGSNLGAEATTSPYTVNWDTTQSTNGSHTLTAIARDAAGNKTTSAGITVNAANSLGNLVLFMMDAGAGNIIAFHLDVTPVSITDSNGVTTALVSGSLPLELTHLNMAPTLAVPATSLRGGSYTSINLSLANPQLVILSGGVPIPVANPTLKQTSISVPLSSLNLIAGGTQGLALDFDLPNSISVDANGNYTITPVLHPVTTTSSSPGMQVVDVVGQIVNLPATSPNAFDFQVPRVTGTARIVTDANTVFDSGVTQFADLQKNQFVEIEGVLQNDGTFLAKYVELSAADQSLRIQGLVTGIQQDAQNHVNAVNVVPLN